MRQKKTEGEEVHECVEVAARGEYVVREIVSHLLQVRSEGELEYMPVILI